MVDETIEFADDKRSMEVGKKVGKSFKTTRNFISEQSLT